ncbi:probable isoprenylcysteine alpha-carbonyl methylesterase ICMEL2 isoform X2 [Physcomitrium patens]|uniref:probable isoprenylcysteine alpha-carbonyl methylesterase ICMEL2 isoform X2 n=1 Tax=Physcomitrium patens TaxID=3218 RepID=UPI000D16EE36|nr:probable isoprenylcysteine alpha-carbonyl methylesterase ICMEL2 isoform X2 [Physcomitrium patens]|eukprot:XP_024383589.1 probable isoprenylcysteine alpha-carbonyl methylesterase ICMEL2 isoform X2 [Physcomitrella patens]
MAKRDLEEVVEMLPAEEIQNDTMMLRSGWGLEAPSAGLLRHGGSRMTSAKVQGDGFVCVGSVKLRSTASGAMKTDVGLQQEAVGVGAEDRDREDGNHRKVLRFQSEVAARGVPRLSSQRTPLAGAEHGRRRTFSGPSQFGGGGPLRQGSFKEFTQDVQAAAAETYLITRLALTLLKFLGVGTRWISKFIRLSLYAMFLMIGFIQVGYSYYYDPRIHRSLIYGEKPRNRFDLYLPPDTDKLKPVFIFITGGAWVIGYKAWGTLLAQQLVDCDIIVACIDYRNFPQGGISDMISDVETGIGYVIQKLESYGGDPNMVYLAGQSAGAHLATCALLKQAEKEITQDPADLVWRSSQIKECMAISGGYNLTKLVDHFHKRGLYKSIFLSMVEGEKSLATYSPELMVLAPSFRKAVPLLPPITLYHGTADYSIPHDSRIQCEVGRMSCWQTFWP